MASASASTDPSENCTPKRARISLEHLVSKAASQDDILSWRDGQLSDWTVTLSSKRYSLHAFQLARSARFFKGHVNIESEVRSGKRESDITEVLPEACHAAFEHVLDFMYWDSSAVFHINPDLVVIMLKISDILGMPRLSALALARIKDTIAEHAHGFLEQFHSFHVESTEESEALQTVHEHCLAEVIGSFHRHLVKDSFFFSATPHACVARYLEFRPAPHST